MPNITVTPAIDTLLKSTVAATATTSSNKDAVAALGAVVTGGALGTPAAGSVLTNATGLPIVAGTSGTLTVERGGTNATTASTARTNILPSFTGNGGKVLAVNAGATDVEYISASGTGSVTSVALAGGTTGLTTSGGPITAAGTITLAGTLAVANGGTGLTTLTAGGVLVGAGTSTPTFVAPSTAGNVLTSNGSTWTSATTTREMPVMTKASWSRYANSSTGILSMTSRRRVVATVSAKNLKLVFQNSYSESNGHSNITVKASVEDDLGTIYPVYFSGSRTATVLNTGELLTSDAIANLITGKGRTYFLRVNSSWASGNVYLNGVVDNTTQTGEGRIDSLDYTDSGTITPTTNYAYTANMVIGTPLAHNPYETIIFLGDSNMDLTAQGGYLTWEDNWTVSSLGRDAGRNFSYVRLSVGGSRVSTVLDAASTRRRRFFPYGSIFIVLLGTNDARDHVNTPTTAAAIMANLVTLYRELLAAGAKEVWACTLPPDTSATNQNAIRVALNDLIRAEPNPLTGVLDLADELETARNSNVWKTNYASGDLYHLSATAGAAVRDWLRALMFSQR